MGITCLNTTDTKRGKFETPVPKTKIESIYPKPYYYLIPLKPEIHLGLAWLVKLGTL
jgi:hypothetical protein